jgi:hypothetical protein
LLYVAVAVHAARKHEPSASVDFAEASAKSPRKRSDKSIADPDIALENLVSGHDLTVPDHYVEPIHINSHGVCVR